MSAGWEVGDKAVCIDISRFHCGGLAHVPRSLQVGEVREVVAVLPADCGNCVGLVFNDCQSVAQRFRKIKPDAHESCEDEFITLLNRSKQGVKA